MDFKYFIFPILLLSCSVNAQIYLNVNTGSAFYTSGLKNLHVHAAAGNQNTANVSKEMNVQNFGYGAGFQIGIKQNGVNVYTGWEFRRNGYGLKDESGNTLDWRLTTRKLTLIGMGWDNENMEAGFGVDVGKFALMQNSKGIYVFNQGLATTNTNGWVPYYEKNKTMFGTHIFFGYKLTDLFAIRASYFWNFIPVEPNFKENTSEVFQYNASFIDLSLVFHLSSN